jgi:elongation factor Ts
MSISAADVKTLRDRTNAPMMECKAALTEASGDMEKAIEILRKKMKDVQDKKGVRETAEGRIAIYIDPVKQVGAILEMRCESAPAAKNALFVLLANDIARQIALRSATTVEALLDEPFVDHPSKTVSDRIADVVGLIRENMKPVRFTRLTGILGGYVHHDGNVGVLLQVEGNPNADPQLLREVPMHITARNPVVARRQDISEATLAKEKAIAQAQLVADPKNQGKPANILEKIVEGKMKSWFADNVLEEQPFVKDETKTVGQLLQYAGLKVVRFVRYRVGEIS